MSENYGFTTSLSNKRFKCLKQVFADKQASIIFFSYCQKATANLTNFQGFRETEKSFHVYIHNG